MKEKINKRNNCGVQSNFWRDKDKEEGKKKIVQTFNRWSEFLWQITFVDSLINIGCVHWADAIFFGFTSMFSMRVPLAKTRLHDFFFKFIDP